jgi:trimethylamine--corrinoid protein Co-methyltransferase
MYGSVPVRARLDDLHDLYGCPEFNWYNVDCVQLAKYYKLPCYSSAGVGDAKVPGAQSIFEKLLTQLYMAMSGAQYIHYALGLLDRTNTFCPLAAVLDNEMIGKVKHCLKEPKMGPEDMEGALKTVDKVMSSPSRLFARHARKAMHAGDVSDPFKFEGKGMEDQVILKAYEELARLDALPAPHLDERTVAEIYSQVPGILPGLKKIAAA